MKMKILLVQKVSFYLRSNPVLSVWVGSMVPKWVQSVQWHRPLGVKGVKQWKQWKICQKSGKGGQNSGKIRKKRKNREGSFILLWQIGLATLLSLCFIHDQMSVDSNTANSSLWISLSKLLIPSCFGMLHERGSSMVLTTAVGPTCNLWQIEGYESHVIIVGNIQFLFFNTNYLSI